MTNFKYYNYEDTGQDLTHKPINTHLFIEVDSDTLYYVDSVDQTKLYKYIVSTDTESLITTRTKNIAREWFDRTNNKIYFVDCDYDGGTSYAWYLLTTDDSIVEVKSFASCDVFDIFKIGTTMFVQYYETGGYTLETTHLHPDGDGTTHNWTPSAVVDHYTLIDEDEGAPSTVDYVSSQTIDQVDQYEFPDTLDLSAYDSGEIYEIKIWLYGTGGSVHIKGDLTGMTTDQDVIFNSMTASWKSTLFSGLSLTDADIDNLTITMTNISDYWASISEVSPTITSGTVYGVEWDGTYFYITSPLNNHVYKYNSSWTYISDTHLTNLSTCCGICFDGTNFFVVDDANKKVYKYNSSFVYQAEYSISDTSDPNDICYDGTYFYITDSTNKKVYKYNSSFVLQTSYDITVPSGYYLGGITWNNIASTFLITQTNLSNTIYYKEYDISFNLIKTYTVSGLTASTANKWMICWDGNSYWHANASTSKVYEFKNHYCKVSTLYIQINFYGNAQYYLDVENLTDSTKDSNNMGDPAARTYDCSQMMVKSATEIYFLWNWSNENVELWKYNNTAGTFTQMEDLGANTELPTSIDRRTITYDNNDILSFTLYYNNDSKYYYCIYSIGDDAFTKKGEYSIILQMDRNCNTSNIIPFNLEKGFSLTEDKVYQISTHRGNLWMISVHPFDDIIIAISDTYLVDNSLNLYKYQDMMPYIVEWWVDHSKEDYPVAEILLRSNYISVAKNMLMQLIGKVTMNGATLDNQVAFEGLVKAYDSRTLRAVRLESPAKEMDQVKPSGDKSGRTDEIITDMSNDANGISYISMGTLSNGAAMDTLTLGGDKTWRTLLDNFKDIDTFTWYLTSTGELYYDNGETVSGCSMMYDGGANLDIIEDANGYFLSSEVNQVIVRGAIGIESDPANNLEDQQKNGIILLIVRDATLNTKALCDAKAAAIIARITEISTIDALLDLSAYGFVQPGQTLIFKFITTDVSIAQDTFTIDRIKFEAKSEDYSIVASNGLVFEMK